MISQQDFDQLVRNYNEDYQYLLVRASNASYECLISSFMILKDLYEVIVKFQDTGTFEFRVLPLPLSFRANDDLLKSLGFIEEDISNIYGFLEFVKSTQGKEFEECLKDNVYNLCKTNPGDRPWQMRT
jgi:hypothetical protein